MDQGPGSFTLRFRPGATEFLRLATDPSLTEVREVACLGTRGDGKTIVALGSMVQHALYHKSLGHALPTTWLGVRDTFEQHRLNVHRSLQHPLWQGHWTLHEQGHVAHFTMNRTLLIRLHLFGVEHANALERLRTECHAIWFEEPAPVSGLVESAGISEDAWAVALTSRRLETYRNPAILTMNYPDEDHWTWQRFVERKHPGTRYVRIPPGERSSASQRREWAEALSGRPAMLKRLLAGEPASVAWGAPVAETFRGDLHVSDRPLDIREDDELVLGWDGGHTPTTVILVPRANGIRCVAGLYSKQAGMRQHIEEVVLPWLDRCAPWALQRRALRHAYDPSLEPGAQDDIERSALRAILEALPGPARPGPVGWPPRYEALVMATQSTKPFFLVDPGPATDDLRRALNGRWCRAPRRQGSSSDTPLKPNHPWEDLGDALCYGLWVALGRETAKRKPRRRVIPNAPVYSFSR